jgi:hypothetical protein
MLLACGGLVARAQGPPAAATPVPTPQAKPAGADSGAANAPAAAPRSVAKTKAPPTAIAAPDIPAMPRAPGTEFDRLVAIVNDDVILDSDVDQERRFAALLPYGEAGGAYSRDRAIERLINRDLILQQSNLQQEEEISDAAVDKDLDSLRKAIPACRELHCETKAGWDRFLATQGFTEASFDPLWKQRMQVLAFIEQRFRMGIKITPEQIQHYYDNDLRTEFAAQKATPPPLDTVSDRIQQVLLEQQVSSLLTDWLRSLRAQGSVVLLHPGEDAP